MENNVHKIGGYIYVTNDEKPKLNDFVWNKSLDIVRKYYLKVNNITSLQEDDFKVILTNNPELITVQKLTKEEESYLKGVDSCEVDEIETFPKQYLLRIPTEQPLQFTAMDFSKSLLFENNESTVNLKQNIMSEFKGTRGEVEINKNASRNVRVNGLTVANCSQGQSGDNEEEEKANALMIADAFKVRQQINCELSELLEQRNEMLAMLEKIISEYAVEFYYEKEIKELIAKNTKL